MITFKNTFLILLGFTLLSLQTKAQQGYSSGSISHHKAKTKKNKQAISNQNQTLYLDYNYFPKPEEVILEEYMNYHDHKLPLPKRGEAVSLKTDWGRDVFSSQGQEVIFQVGLATNRLGEDFKRPPLNITMVIDNSGSMAGHKIEQVKKGLNVFVEQLRKEDYVSIVAFNSQAEVIQSATKVENVTTIKSMISQIYAGGGTNLEGGLKLGYQEVLKNYNPKITNRILILTDGEANVGEISPEQLTKDPSQYNHISNINLSAIGVGLEYNSDLLRQLISNAGGQIHFIDNNADIEKVFDKEVGSLIFPIARKAKLEIEFDKNLELTHFFGYEPIISNNRISLYLKDMNSDLTQIMVVRFRLEDKTNTKATSVKVRLSYFDVQKQRNVIKTSSALLNFSNKNSLSESLKKNYTISYLTQSLQDMAKLCDTKNPIAAQSVLDKASNAARRLYSKNQDEDIERITDILQGYNDVLAEFNNQNKKKKAKKTDNEEKKLGRKDAADISNNLPKTLNQNPEAVAVVIGNALYKKTKNVDYAIADAKMVKKYLVEVLGFRQGNIIYIENASYTDFKLIFGDKDNPHGKLYNRVKPNKSDVFVFYSGHGAPSLKDSKAYFVPVECDPQYVELTGYPTEYFYNNLAKIPSKSTVLALDACFSGENIYENISPIHIKTKGALDLKDGALLASSRGNQVSTWYNEKGHGMFTYFFLKAIHNKNADENRDNQLTLAEIHKYMADKANGVPYYARRLHGIEQNPVIKGQNPQKVLVKYQ